MKPKLFQNKSGKKLTNEQLSFCDKNLVQNSKFPGLFPYVHGDSSSRMNNDGAKTFIRLFAHVSKCKIYERGQNLRSNLKSMNLCLLKFP